jgi:phage tail sheath gpL-like
MLLPPRAPLIRNSALGTGVPHENYTPSVHINNADFVTETLNTIAPSGPNPTLILGIAEHDSDANWGGQLPPPSPQHINQVLGATNVGLGGLVSPSPKQTIVATLGPNIGVEMSLTPATAWVTGTPAATASTTVGGTYVAGETLTTDINGNSVIYVVPNSGMTDQQIAVGVAALINSTPATYNVATAGTPVAGVIPLTAAVAGTTGNTFTLTVAHNSAAGTYTASGATFAGGTGFDAILGTLVGLAVDATTGYYLADPLASNLIGRIFAKPFAPNGPFGGGSGFPGDFGARVLVEFLPSALQATQGE